MIDNPKNNPLKRLSPLGIWSIFLAVALMLCLLDMPYGFYTIVRLASAVIASCWAMVFYNGGKTGLAVGSVAVAILFQPLIKISLDKGTWNVLDIIFAIVLVYFSLRQNKK